MWDAFYYSEVFARQFNAEECERIIALHDGSGALESRVPQGDGAFIRDSDLFWIARTAQTEWIFERVWNLATLYNSRDGFALLAEMDQLQLTPLCQGSALQLAHGSRPGCHEPAKNIGGRRVGRRRI